MEGYIGVKKIVLCLLFYHLLKLIWLYFEAIHLIVTTCSWFLVWINVNNSMEWKAHEANKKQIKLGIRFENNDINKIELEQVQSKHTLDSIFQAHASTFREKSQNYDIPMRQCFLSVTLLLNMNFVDFDDFGSFLFHETLLLWTCLRDFFFLCFQHYSETVCEYVRFFLVTHFAFWNWNNIVPTLMSLVKVNG